MKPTGIIAAIEQQERLATGSGELAEQRATALDRYMGRPYGNEQEGRSQVVMRDVADTVEWIKPSLMKVFASGDEICSFDPVGPEDIQQAEQETEYCNYVLMSKNNGFLILHDWFHDALVQKTGYVMVQYETEKVPSRETYKGLADDELALLLQDDPEVLEHTPNPTPFGVMHDITIRANKEYGCVKIANIAPERVMVASDWPDVDLQGCPFVEVVAYPTISSLREQGYDIPDDISDSGSGNKDDKYQQSQRSVTLDDQTTEREDLGADAATRRVRTRYVWIQFDEDGDGIAELRKVIVIGTTEIENEEDDFIPLAAITPMRIPHEHYGQSIDDIVNDLQEIRTTLTRGFLDNMYLANNGRYAIDANIVNLDDMLVARPGGVVRTKGPPAGAIQPLLHPQQGRDIVQAIEYIDSVRENRTGVTKYNQGLDGQSLNKTAHGITQIMNASQQRVELIARIFAETGVKALMLLIHAVSIKNGRKAEMVKLRNQWVAVDPREWKTRRDVTASVGLGNGNKDQMLQHLMLILQAQQQALQIGVATPPNIYHALTKLTQNAGFKDVDSFWTDPNKNPMPPQPNPDAIKAQADAEKHKSTLEADAQKFQAQAQLDAQSQHAESQEKERDRQLQVAIAQMQEATKLAIAELNANAQKETAMHAETMRAQPVKAEVDNTNVQQAVEKNGQDMTGILTNLTEAMNVLGQQLSRPKQILRGPDGRVTGVQ